MDKRKNNGGNSTKSTGVDKRKNPYKQAIENAITDEELEAVIKMLYTKSVTDKDVNAAKELLNRCLGKSLDTKEINHSGAIQNILNLGNGIKPDKTTT